MNREAWLTELSDRVRPLFKDFKLTPFRVTCGWPCRMALSPGRKRIGECHGPASSGDGHSEIFISPLLAKPIEVADTLVHEMAHVAAGIKAAHGKWFVRVARHVGLTKGKPASVGMGSRLQEQVLGLMKGMGVYPHAAMRPVSEKVLKKDSPIVSLVCICECRITMSRKMLQEYGAPKCTCGNTFTKKES